MKERKKAKEKKNPKTLSPTLTVAWSAVAPLISAALHRFLRSSDSASECPGLGVGAALSILIRRASRCLRSSSVIRS